MKHLLQGNRLSYNLGVAPIIVLLFILLILGIFLGIDYGYVFYLDRCGDTSLSACFNDSTKNTEKPTSTTPDTSNKAEIISAKGNLSKEKYSVSVLMTFPLGGGEVTGQFNGTCDGKITGTSTSDGKITGKAFGSCSPLFVPIPARAEFDGVVIPSTRTVPITGSGTAMGISKSGTITLTY